MTASDMNAFPGQLVMQHARAHEGEAFINVAHERKISVADRLGDVVHRAPETRSYGLIMRRTAKDVGSVLKQLTLPNR